MSDKQKTLSAPIAFKGRGLHTGLDVTVKILPADADTGIVFKRVDLETPVCIPALSEYVNDTSRGTTIEKDGARVSTVEHIMAALWMSGIDNAVVEIDGCEVPIMDGSAREYMDGIAKAGITDQNALRKYYEVTQKTTYRIEDKNVEIELYPDDEFSVSVHIDYGSKVLGNQFATFCHKDDFATAIAPCRTFVFLHELEPLLKQNLIKGGDLDNAIIVVENEISDEEFARLAKIFNKQDIKASHGYLNNLELRFPNEPARHKLLDVLGDFALLGLRIKGKVLATRPGHLANTETMKMLKKNIRRDAAKPQYKYNPAEVPVYDINKIKELLAHRPPFLLVDKIIHIDSESVGGIKNVTMNEPFFVGHFPDEPVMPGVLIVEAMAQCGGILALHDIPDPENYSTYFLKIDGVKFKRKVVPGDTLQFELKLVEPMRRGIVTMDAKAFVGGLLTTEAQLTAQIVKNK